MSDSASDMEPCPTLYDYVSSEEDEGYVSPEDEPILPPGTQPAVWTKHVLASNVQVLRQSPVLRVPVVAPARGKQKDVEPAQLDHGYESDLETMPLVLEECSQDEYDSDDSYSPPRRSPPVWPSPSPAGTQHVRTSNVYVMEVGSVSSPGDHLIECFRKQEVNRVCLPKGQWKWILDLNYDGWLFLKPSPTGVLNVKALNYVSLAIKTHRFAPHDPSILCDCEGGHDEATMGQVFITEVRRFSPVRV